MKRKWVWTLISLVVFGGIVEATSIHAQKSPKTLTLLYSNNINGEVDPCPT
jgi:hypothetical protein